MDSWEVKALYNHTEDQINAMIEDRVHQVCVLMGMITDDPYDLKYLNTRPCPFNNSIKFCRVMENNLCAGIECDYWKKYEGE